MKKLLLILMVLFPLFSAAQIIGFHENFELPSLGDSLSSSGAPNTWGVNTNLFHSGLRSDSSVVSAADTAYFTTIPFSTVGNSFVILHFSHICKIELLDAGEIEVSANGGPWVKLTGIEYIDPGNSQFITNGNKFNSNSYPVLWQPVTNTAIPNNTWWKDEAFDISALVGNSSDVRIRFILRDGNGNGANGNYGWILDDISVVMSFSELDPPTITYLQPFLLGVVYNLGPFDVTALLQDASGIQSGTVFYKVNSGPLDSVLMTVVNGDTMVGTLPAVTDFDTIRYYIRAIDASPAQNTTLNPVSGFRTFVATHGLEFPYVDDFDGPSVMFFDTTMSVGTEWQLGTPAYGMTNNAHSPPNAWDVNLSTTYLANANCYLYTPVFDFSSTSDARMSFWVNYRLELCCDGVTMEYTTDGLSWQVLGTLGDPNAVNWFTNSSVSSSGGRPVWTGNSGGWRKVEYLLTQLNNQAGPVQFRFVFVSSASTQYDGFSIDDFSIIPPFEQDIEMVAVLEPDISGCVPAGNNTLTVIVENTGTDTLTSGFNIAYSLDLQAPVTEIIPDILLPGERDTLSFSSPVNLSNGAHELLVYLEYGPDLFSLNDTLDVEFTAFAPLSLPYFNNLDSAASMNDFCLQTATYGRVFYDTIAAHTGDGGVVFDAVATTGYTVISDTNTGSATYVWSPTVNALQEAQMRMIVNTASLSHLVLKFDLKLLYYINNNYSNFRVVVDGVQLTPHLLPQGMTSAYLTYEYDLSAFLPAATLTIEFQSKVYTTHNYTVPNGTGIFLDNIQVYEPPPQEVSLISMLNPISGCGLGVQNVQIHLKNSGSDTISGNIQASYFVAGNSPIAPETIPDTLVPGDTLTYTFVTPLDMTVSGADSVFDITAFLELSGDPFQFNDSVARVVNSLFVPDDPDIDSVFVIPYATDTLLHANSVANLYWFDSPTGTNYILMGPDYQTPVLYDTAIYYVEARNGSAGTHFYIGNGVIQNTTYSYPCPYGQYYNGAREQFLYLASELTNAGIGPGPIQALAFDVVTPAGANLMNLNLKMAHTNMSALSSWVTGSLTQVFSTSLYTTFSGWNEHSFSTPFVWDGVSNIIIESCFDNYPNGYTTNAILNQSTTTFVSCRDNHSDGGNVCPPVSPTSSSAYSQRPNIRFVATSSGCASSRVPVEVQVSNVPTADVGVLSIETPNTGINLGSETVSVNIYNYGSSAVSDIPVFYQVNGMTVIADTVSDTIQPGDTLLFLFTQQANISVFNTYNFVSWTELPGDIYTINDTAYKTVENQFPVYCDSYATSTADDDITSVIFAGINNVSPTPYNGTYSDYTGLPPANVFRGASYPISVGIGFSGSGYAGYCEAYIDFNADGVFTEPDEVVFGSAYSSTPLSQVLSGTISIPQTAASGMTILRLVARESATAASTLPCGTYSWGETEDYRVYIYPILHNDAELTSFTSPLASESEGIMTPVEVALKNSGLDTLSAVDIHWSKDAGPNQLYSWSGTLAPGQTQNVTVGSELINSGLNTFIAFCDLPGDSNAFNDTARLNSFGLPPLTLYLDDFEGATTAWTTSPNSLWARGKPTSTLINYAHSPDTCWKTRLNGNYLNNREDYLYSPNISLHNISGAVLRFWHWWETEPLDGGNIQYSINGGSTWITLGYQNDPAGVNWYNTFTNGKYFWTGEWGEWRDAIYDLSQFNNQSTLKFRFYFYANATLNTYNGWAIDDFEIRVPRIPIDAGVTQILEPTPVIPGGMVHPSVIIHNFGTDTLFTIPMAYVMTGGGMIIENWTGTLLPDSNTQFDFSNSFISPGGTYSFCAFASMPADYYRFNDSTCVLVLNNTGLDEYEAFGFALGQNIPNPAEDVSKIPFFIPESGRIRLSLYNVYGAEMILLEDDFPAGSNEVVLQTEGIAAGMYYYTMEYLGKKLTRKMLISR